MQAGSLVSSDVMEYSYRVTVDGEDRKVTAWSVSREIQSDLPAAIGGGSGITQGTADISWAGEDVADGSLNPWNSATGWTPKPGQKVSIWCGDGVSEWLQFVGFVDDPSGTILGEVVSSLIDNSDAMSAVVNTPAMLATMPPLKDDDTDPLWTHRFPGLGAAFYVNLAARESGYYSTPSTSSRTVLDVPMQGSMTPLVGDMVTCSAMSSSIAPPLTGFTSWGDVIGDLDSRFIPKVWSGSDIIQISFMLAPTHTGTARITVTAGASTLALVGTSTLLSLEVDGVTVASLPRGSETMVIGAFDGSTAELRTGDGRAASGSTTAVDLGAELTMVRATGTTGCRVAGLQIERPTASSKFRQISFQPTYSFNFGTARVHTHKALPSVSNVPARDLFSQIGEALLAPTWIDETGKLKTLSGVYMYEQPPVATLDTKENILGMAWSNSLRHQRSKITGKYQLPVISQRPRYAVTVYEGTLEALEQADTHEVLISPENGEDWIMVDSAGAVVGKPGWDYDRVNKGQGSVLGATYTDGANDTYAINAAQTKAVIKLRTIDHDSFTYSVTAQGIDPGYQVETRTLSPSFSGVSALWPQWWGKNLPIIRAKAKVTWTDVYTPAVTTGAIGPAYEHDFGPWATGSGDRETSIMDGVIAHISSLASLGFARINRLTVTPDPRLQVGDRVTVESEDFLGTSIDAIIIGSELSFSDSLTQALSVRVLSVRTTYTTYAQLNMGASQTYSEWQADGPDGQTYSGFNTI